MAAVRSGPFDPAAAVLLRSGLPMVIGSAGLEGGLGRAVLDVGCLVAVRDESEADTWAVSEVIQISTDHPIVGAPQTAKAKTAVSNTRGRAGAADVRPCANRFIEIPPRTATEGRRTKKVKLIAIINDWSNQASRNPHAAPGYLRLRIGEPTSVN